MLNQTTKRRDAFTFSLGGMTAVSGFMGVPAIADNHFNKACDAKAAPRPVKEYTRWSLRRRSKTA